MTGTCFSCEHENPPDHVFCSACGSPLSLSSYVARQVDARLGEATKDRAVVETDAAIRVFERAWGWAKLVVAAFASVSAILVAAGIWQYVNLSSTAKSAETAVLTAKNSAETSINETASGASSNINRQATATLKDVHTSAEKATTSSAAAEASAKRESAAVSNQAATLRRDLQEQATTVTKDVASARQQIQAASQLQPQMQSIQQQLHDAQTQIKDQQQVITSSEDFAKKIFSSHKQFVIDLTTADKTSFAVIDQPPVKGVPRIPRTALYLILPDAPVTGTIQLQFFETVSPPNAFFTFHNLLVAFLETGSKSELLGKAISVSYFPDPADKSLMHSLITKDGRVLADGEALMKFGQIDPDFKGSKWMSVQPPPILTPVPGSAPK